ncbi:cell filamentation protein Fic [Arachnia propionica]|uniref:Cell filamentation protein Fic n=1 Tax=Arachnia propionica TaxID=1750 RepID=A0A3P1TB96_9ACTN|nr:Fic family protein [Arachnia propionica]MDO5082159.1 Fic family protein [Arachnia propionica]RRD06702.1 cell filamentation protein Fic [Arachnia propionica]
MAQQLSMTDLVRVIYSSGKVFDGLGTGRVDTENFLRSGSADGITSRSDLALLQDLRDVAQFIIEHSTPVDAAFVRQVNAQLTRSAAINPGSLRTAEQQIGVRTRYGRHLPEALTEKKLQRLVGAAIIPDQPVESALALFLTLAKAQPFEDGNKRTALFVANAHLITHDTGLLLTVPFDEDDPSVADRFNDLLARAYVFDEHDAVRDMLRSQGLAPV